jgi:hypothetical protein
LPLCLLDVLDLQKVPIFSGQPKPAGSEFGGFLMHFTRDG